MEPKALAPAKINPTKLLGGSSFAIKKISVSNNIGPQKDNLVVIKTQVIEIKNLIKSSTLLKQVELEKKRKQKEKDKSSKKEAELEAKKEEPDAKKVKVPGLPKLGFLERIKNIIFTVLLGRFIVKMLPNLPKLLGVVKAVSTGVEFAADFSVGLINALGTFIQKTDEASKQTRGFLRTIGGDNSVKLFDGFNNAINAVIIATIAATQLPSFDEPKKGPSGDITSKGVGQAGSKSAKRILIRTLGRGGAKAVLGAVKPFLKRLPVVGALIDFGLSVALGENPGRAAFKAIGAGLLGAVGAAAGSVVPFAGTLLGGLAGGALGDMAGGALYDLFFGKKSPSKPKVQGRAQGGTVTRGGKFTGGPAKRGVSKTKKRGVTAQPTKLKPGADIGGQKNIEKVFPSPQGKDKSKQVNPLGYIKKSYDRVSKAPFFGALLSLTTKALSGQKPSQLDYSTAAQGLNNWMSVTFSSGVLRTGGAFSGGGEANAEMFLKGEDLTRVIAKSLEDNVSQQLEGSIQDLMKQMMLKKEEPKPNAPPTVPQGQEGAADFSGSTGAEKTMHYLISQGLTGAQAAGIAGNLQQEGGFDPAADNGTHHGIAQWDKQIRWPRVSAYISSIGMDPNTLEGQLVGLKWEAQQRGNWQKIKQSKSVQEASDIWLKEFEIPGNYEEESPRRAAFGNGLFAKYGNYVPVVSSVPGATLGNIAPDARGTKLSGDLGDFMKAWGGVPGSIWQHSRHGGQGYRSYSSFHNVDRAIDLGANANEQGPILRKIEEFNRLKGIRPVQILHAGNDPKGNHNDHVHVAYFSGGPTGKGGIVRTHPGEYIIDKDSVDAFGIDFFDIINQTESVSQRKNSSKQLMSILQFYAGYESGGRQKIKVKVPAPQVSYIPVPVPVGGGMVMSGGSSTDSDYDSTYA